MSDKVLIADDDEAISKLLSKVLLLNGFEPHTVNDGLKALQELKKDTYQLLLLDVMMPNLDGFQVIKRIRQEGNTIPIIVVSGKNEDYDALYGLDIGADDYIMKPFNPIVLGAKAKALVRRTHIQTEGSDNCTKRGCFTFDNKTMRLYKNDTEIILSSKEKQLMKLFIDYPDQVFPKNVLYEQIWGELVVDENAIMVYINRLRNKIEEDPKNPKYINTVWGIGYSFTPENEK
ncbi:MAG: response regulator transcription factor [Treponema sp.]|nr:response regulator transcription factor [Treponema sp.]